GYYCQVYDSNTWVF
nr:immunoglobulin light chain junction region [Macaca mulatta]